MMQHAHLVKNLVDSLDIFEAVKHSYAALHVKGLQYVNLFRDERMTVKLYIIDDRMVTPVNDRRWLVWPHNHAYNFYTEVLVGAVTNVVFDGIAHPDGEYFEEWWNSPLKGGKGFVDLKRPAKLHVKSMNTYRAENPMKIPGNSYYTTVEEVHTIIPEPNKVTVLGLIQYHDILPRTHMYTPRDQELPECLYEPMDPAKMMELLIESGFMNNRDARIKAMENSSAI